MNLRFFIDRPVFSIVISVTIVLLGIIALTTLSVEQYPDIAPPTVQVTTSYPGANAETVQKAVIVPLEEAINAAAAVGDGWDDEGVSGGVRDGWRLAVGTLTILPVAPPERVDAEVATRAALLAPLAFASVALGVGAVG